MHDGEKKKKVDDVETEEGKHFQDDWDDDMQQSGFIDNLRKELS